MAGSERPRRVRTAARVPVLIDTSMLVLPAPAPPTDPQNEVVAFPAELAGERLDGVIVDLSLNGAFIRCQPTPPLLARVSMIFELEGHGHTSAIGLVVRRWLGPAPGIGVIFEAMSVAARQVIVEMVRRLGGSDMRVLVVEDSDVMRRHIVDAIGQLEIEQVLDIVEAADGVSALKLLKAQRFDLMIADINLPQMDGLKLASAFRTDPNHRDAHIMIVSAEKGADDLRQARDLGINVFLNKPVQKVQILEAVRSLLRL